MEAAAVAWVCSHFSLPLLCVKAITDIVDDGRWVSERGSGRGGRCVFEELRGSGCVLEGLRGGRWVIERSRCGRCVQDESRGSGCKAAGVLGG